MPIHQEGFTATQEHVYEFPAVDQPLRSRNSVRKQEQSIADLRAAVESLQQIVAELLLRNQVLRMGLDKRQRDGYKSPGHRIRALSSFRRNPLCHYLFPLYGTRLQPFGRDPYSSGRNSPPDETMKENKVVYERILEAIKPYRESNSAKFGEVR